MKVTISKKDTIKNDKNVKRKSILIFACIFITVFSIIIIKPISNLDEIWNYNTARAISEGLNPYKDISMITTPLLPMVTAIFLKLIANEIIVSRILAALLWTGILFTIYKIFTLLIKEENTSLIVTALIGILCRDIYCIDYNIVVLVISLVILYQELKDIQNISSYNKKKDFTLRNISRTCNMYKTKHRSNSCCNCCNV